MFNRDVIRQSVDEIPDSDYPSHSYDGSGLFWFGSLLPENDILARWGMPQRLYQQRESWYGLYNTLPGSAMTNLIRRWVGTNWELRSEGDYKPRVIKRWQDRLQQSQNGDGWSAFMWRIGQDYLNLDLGAFIEIVGRGRSDQPLRGEVMGIKALDAMRCYPTGDPEYPVWYASHKTGELHRMHYTRVKRIVDNPSPDPAMRGLGVSATSRLFIVKHVQGLIQRYRAEKLSDLPPQGIVSISGIMRDQWDQAVKSYEFDRGNNNQAVFRNLLPITPIRGDGEVKINVTPFSQLPDGFDYQQYLEVDVNLTALAIGEDPQEIWPLRGSNGLSSTATQSTILDKKGKAKTFGTFLAELERIFNIFILPPELELTFKQRDEDQVKSQAEAAAVWVQVANDAKAATGMSNEQAAELLARTVPELGDVLLDASGQLILLTDIDKPADDQLDQELELDQEPQEAEPQAGDDETVMAANDSNTLSGEEKAIKAIQATRSDFENDFEDVLIAANNRSGNRRNLTRRRASARIRAIIARDINRAFRDALEEHGVPESEISDTDKAEIDRMIRIQSGLVSALLDRVYSEDGLSDAEILNKPAMWWNGSIQPAYNSGVMSADKNGMYEFTGRVKPDSCPDCKRMKGQIHRFKDYKAKGLDVPHVGQNTECGGYHCVDKLVKRPGAKARGRF